MKKQKKGEEGQARPRGGNARKDNSGNRGGDPNDHTAYVRRRASKSARPEGGEELKEQQISEKKKTTTEREKREIGWREGAGQAGAAERGKEKRERIIVRRPRKGGRKSPANKSVRN